jgi:hypothetical protein
MSVVGVVQRAGETFDGSFDVQYRRLVIGVRLMRTSPDKTIMPFAPPTRDRTARRIIDPASAELFSHQYNRMSFRFEHGLNGHPLLGISNLVKLSARHPEDSGHAYWCNGRVRVNDSWDAGRPQCLSLQQTVAGIANNDSLVLLKHVEADSELGPLVAECIATVLDLVGPQMRDDVIVARGTLLIASPHRLTQYHIDADVNFLFQVEGDKVIRIFNQNDRTLLTEPMLEKYHQGDISGAQFAAARDDEACVWELHAGQGVHIPYTAPHWATTLDSPSVALSINFDLRSTIHLPDIYRVNAELRRHGLAPTSPGVSPWRDDFKLAALNAFRVVRLVRHRH